MIRVFLVDDHTILRNGIRALLSQEAGLLVVGEAGNGQELLDQLPATPADVVLLDINMPVMDGVATARHLAAEYPQVRVLALSMLGHERHVGQMFEAGAHGYILKNAEKREILTAIEMVAAGKQFLCSDVGLEMMQKLLRHEQPGEKPRTGPLSPREMDVLRLLADGLTTKEIADKLFTSTRTIETHRQNIIEKTQVKNTAALVRWAVAEGLVK